MNAVEADNVAEQGSRMRLDRAQKISIAGMASVIVGFNVVGWAVLFLVVAPQNLSLGSSGVLGVGIGVTAFMLGMRHAFDADHIAAIDNTTRKLMEDGQRPVSVGFWFALGHSSVVFGLCALLSVGVRALAGQVEDDGSTLQTTFGLIGTLVSGVFLLLIGIINLFVLRKIVGVFRQMKAGEYSEQELEDHLNSRGFFNRYLGRITGWSRCLRTSLVRHHVLAVAVYGWDVAARHNRRLFHELRLWLGIFAAGAEGVLQHHDHRVVGVCRTGYWFDRNHRIDCGEVRH